MRAAKTDRNQAEIIAALRAAGCSVQPLHRVGQGCPDILVGASGQNILMEIKDGEQPPSQRLLTVPQQKWHFAWRGQVCVVKSVADALAIINGMRASC